jgi:antirestriction protein ArdC
LNREIENRFGDEKYGREELVAEMSACFLCTETGIVKDNLFENAAAYLQNWIRVLQADRRGAIFCSTDRREDCQSFK